MSSSSATASATATKLTPNQNNHNKDTVMSASLTSPASFMIHSNINSRRGGSSKRRSGSTSSRRRRRHKSTTTTSGSKKSENEQNVLHYDNDEDEGMIFEKQSNGIDSSSSSASIMSTSSTSESSNDIPSLSYSLSPFHSPLLQRNLNSRLKQKMSIKAVTSTTIARTPASLSKSITNSSTPGSKRKHSLSLSITPQKLSHLKSPMSSSSRKKRTKRLPLSPLPQNVNDRGGQGSSLSKSFKKNGRKSIGGISSNSNISLVTDKSFSSSLDYSISTAHENHDDNNNMMISQSKKDLKESMESTKIIDHHGEDDEVKVDQKMFLDETDKQNDRPKVNTAKDPERNDIEQQGCEEKNVDKDIAQIESESTKGRTMTTTTEKKSNFSSHQITVPFPSNDDDVYKALEPKSLRVSYYGALENGTHQRSLKESGCNTLSLDEVLIPTIIASKLSTLRTMIGKARGKQETNQINQLQFMRCILMTCNQYVSYEMSTYREKVSKQRQEHRQQQKKALMEQRQEARNSIQEQKLEQRKRNYEKRRKDRKKNLKKNKELWREVMVLMTDLSRLEKEEKMWDSVDVELVINDPNNTKNIIPLSDDVEDSDKEVVNIPNHAEKVEEVVHDVINDVTVAANRINGALLSINELMKETDDIQREMNALYKRDHKFYGYLGVNDPKALVKGLML